ncbi:MAG: hypothetical protein J3Q66DRAFT_408791 [Benniella sp.]|nr:MAG: hypothetical protein J3Q66DRAFT_408791 [Benniella sp.]
MERSDRLEVTAAASSKKRKAEPEDGNEKLNLGGDGATPKKRSHTYQETDPSAVINPSDPCQVLPTKLWHQTLSLLPLSKVAGLSMVSKTWLDGTRAYPAWKSICDALKLGEPKPCFPSYMALVCVRSSFICDKCHSFTNGGVNASEIPLPVADKDDDDSVWMLCHSCRLEYYYRYPENPRADQVEKDWQGFYRHSILEDQNGHDWLMKWIPDTNARHKYHLSDVDMYGLHFQEILNLHDLKADRMKLYDRYDVQERAVEVHAGWVGVDAFTDGIAEKRCAAAKVRPRSIPKNPQKKKDVQQQQLVEGQKQPSSQSNADGQTQVQASSEDQQRQRVRRSNKRGSGWWRRKAQKVAGDPGK